MPSPSRRRPSRCRRLGRLHRRPRREALVPRRQLRPAVATVQVAEAEVDIAEAAADADGADRSEEHTSEIQSLMRSSYAVSSPKDTQTLSHTHTPRLPLQHTPH